MLLPYVKPFFAVQVKHLVLVETDHARAARLLVDAELKAPRPPVIVQHNALRQ